MCICVQRIDNTLFRSQKAGRTAKSVEFARYSTPRAKLQHLAFTTQVSQVHNWASRIESHEFEQCCHRYGTKFVSSSNKVNKSFLDWGRSKLSVQFHIDAAASIYIAIFLRWCTQLRQTEWCNFFLSARTSYFIFLRIYLINLNFWSSTSMSVLSVYYIFVYFVCMLIFSSRLNNVTWQPCSYAPRQVELSFSIFVYVLCSAPHC